MTRTAVYPAVGPADASRPATEQLAGGYAVWQSSLVNPDFAEYARHRGATGIGVRTAGDLDRGMRALFAADGPAPLSVHSDAELV